MQEMSKEKQIEEMARAMCGNHYNGDCVGGECICKYECIYAVMANRLYRYHDYRKVTRCKDCVYSYFNTSSERYTCDRKYPRRSVEEDDFCNYAKMKGEGKEGVGE